MFSNNRTVWSILWVLDRWQFDSKTKRSLCCLLPRWTRRIKVQLRRTECRLMFAVRVRAEWKPTEIIGFFTQLCATLKQWTDWNSTKIKLLIIPLKIMVNTCSLNWLIKWSSPICIFARFWHCFIEAIFAPLILADLHFPIIKLQSMLTKSFRESWFYLKLLVDIKLESGEGTGILSAIFFDVQWLCIIQSSWRYGSLFMVWSYSKCLLCRAFSCSKISSKNGKVVE